VLLVQDQVDDHWVKKCMECGVEGPGPRGRRGWTWGEVVREDCQARKLNKEDVVSGMHIVCLWPSGLVGTCLM